MIPTPAAASVSSNQSVKRLLPWLVAVAFFMESLDTTILNTAVPAIAKALAVAPLSMKAVLSSYTLSLAMFIPISGWMADRFGTRRVFSSAIGFFNGRVISLWHFQQIIHVLVACHILQGFGGAFMMVPVGRLTLVRTFPKSELIRAMRFRCHTRPDRSDARPNRLRPDCWILTLAGHLFCQPADWPVRFVSGLLGISRIIGKKNSRPLDIIGLILFGSALRCWRMCSAFGRAHDQRTFHNSVVVCFCCFACRIWIESNPDQVSLLRLTLFVPAPFAHRSAAAFSHGWHGGIPFLLFPLLYQIGLIFTPIQSGLLMIPLPSPQ